MWSALPTLRVPAWKPQAPVARSMSHPAPPPALAQCGGLGRPPAASRDWPCWSSRLQPLPQACQPAPRVPSPLLPCALWPHPAQTQSWPRGGPGAGGARGPPLWVPGPGPDPSPPPKFPNSAVPRLLMLGELCRKPGDFLEMAAGWPRTHGTCQTVQSVRAAVTAKEAREGPPGGGNGHGTGAWGRIPEESPEAARGLGFAPDSGPASVALSPPPQEAGPDPATSSWCVV